MRLPFRSKKNFDDLTEAQQNRRIIVRRLGRGIVGVMLAITIVYGGVSWIAGSSLFVPQDAKGVLESVEASDYQTYLVETVRRARLDGHDVRQDARRAVGVDLAGNRFQVETAGVLPEPTVLSSDGEYTLRLTKSAQESGEGWDLITDACNDKPTIDAGLLALPSTEELLAADARLVSDQATVNGERAWLLEFKLTPELLDRLFALRFFDAATEVSPAAGEWVAPKDERAALRAGRVKAMWANAWVSRKQRTIEQLDARFTVEGGAEYRFLIRTGEDPDNKLAERDFGPAPCDAGDGPVVPGE